MLDPAIAMSLLDVTKEQLTDFDVDKHIGKINSDLIGQLMESLVYQSLIVYADALDAHLCHFRDSKGRHEIDFILQKGRKLILFEVKTNSNVKDSYVRHLNQFEEIAGEESEAVLNDFVDAVYTPTITNLQNQIDGQIETWFYNYIPTAENYPASEWTTDTEKDKHLGDLFYVVDNAEYGGQAYRWAKIGADYLWDYVEDTAVVKALADAAAAQDTADQKRRVFVVTPYPPYDVGDLWVGDDTSEMMRCQVSRQSGNYVSTDWIKAVKYTDDTELYNFIQNDYADTIQEIYNSVDQKSETWYQPEDPSLNWTDTESVSLADVSGDSIIDVSGEEIFTVFESEKFIRAEHGLKCRFRTQCLTPSTGKHRYSLCSRHHPIILGIHGLPERQSLSATPAGIPESLSSLTGRKTITIRMIRLCMILSKAIMRKQSKRSRRKPTRKPKHGIRAQIHRQTGQQMKRPAMRVTCGTTLQSKKLTFTTEAHGMKQNRPLRTKYLIALMAKLKYL